MSSRIGVITYPGSQDDRDALWALAALGAEAEAIWHEESDLSGLDAVVVPGGFSYGDHLRCGAIARFSPATVAVCEFAEAGGFVLGICNGFQILCEAGLLPGALLRNESLRFVCRDVPLRVERSDLPFTSRCTPGQRLVIPVKHGDGRYVPPPDLDPAQIVLRYLENPNGSVDAIVASATRRAMSWDSCRTPSTPSIRCSARITARSSSRRSSTPRATAR